MTASPYHGREARTSSTPRFRTGRFTVALLAVLAGALALAATASAAVTVNFTQQVSGVFSGPCTTEPVTVEGQIHVVAAATTDASGGTHLVGHTNAVVRGMTASGVRYVGLENTQFQTNRTAGGAQETSVVFSFRRIRQRSDVDGDDLLVHGVVHFTITENGEVTAFVDRLRFECQ